MRLLSILFLASLQYSVSAVSYPSPPQEPTVAQPQVEQAEKMPGNKKGRKAEVVAQTNVRLRIHLGDKTVLLAETQIPATYSFTHKKGQIQYNQTIRAEDIRELAIENYRARKMSGGKDGDVYEFEPATVRIELKDGQVFKLGYLFKEMRKLKARNSDGAFAVFAFFADTWKPRTGWVERPAIGTAYPPDDARQNFTRPAHPAAFTRLEYFEPIDKAGAEGATDSGAPRK